jgi:hypothetical protein
MIFLIEYDRNGGQIVQMERFENEERGKAQESRLELELRLNRQKIEHEVVLLDAATEEDVRKTHRRYFEDLHELSSVPAG